MQQRGHAKLLHIIGPDAERPSDGDASVGDAIAVSANVPPAGLEMIREDLEHSYIHILQLGDPRVALFGEPTDDVSGEHEKATPKDEPDHCGLQQPRGALESNHGLKERHQGDDQHCGIHTAAPAEVEAGHDHREIIEVEESDLRIDVPMDQHERRDEHDHEQSLEIVDDEPLGPVQSGQVWHGGL